MDDMTWNDLLARISKMSPEEREQAVIVHTEVLDGFHGCTGFGICKEGDTADGVLDLGQLYLEVDG